MKNYIQRGDTLTLIAPYDVLSGGGLLVGSVFGVANGAALATMEVEADTAGVFELAKTSAQAWTQGALVYWDNTAKVVTTTASGNKLIGTAVLAAVNPSPIGTVRLNGAFIS